ncbi:hypothetical protein [Streptomyces sp. NPDC090445]|uniref:hypothetical protein n=1 Tax=Streptomyces sp. NPDC090445 TaxID=3365963 RepID=UPI00381ABF25
MPIASRYDVHEKVWCPPLPNLFQTQTGLERQAMGTSTIWRRLRKCCTELAKTHPEFFGTTFSAHDFRRIFATDLVNSGLPIHIGTPASDARCSRSTQRCCPGWTSRRTTWSPAVSMRSPRAGRGEVEGFELTLTFLRSKRAKVHRTQQLPR